MESIAGTVFRLERTSGEGDSVALGLQGVCYACSDPLAGSDDEGDWFAHGCCIARLDGCVLATRGGLECFQYVDLQE
jgi:hypothetical protein